MPEGKHSDHHTDDTGPHAPPTATVYIVSTLVYNLMAGVIFAAYNAAGYELTGDSPVASTQLGLFAAAGNASLAYMTLLDGWGFRIDGVRGLDLMDGLTSLVATVPLFLWCGRYGGGLHPLCLRAAMRRSWRAAIKRSSRWRRRQPGRGRPWP